MPLAEIDQWFLSSAFAAAPSEVPAEQPETLTPTEAVADATAATSSRR
jgi:hypothetical protein